WAPRCWPPCDGPPARRRGMRPSSSTNLDRSSSKRPDGDRPRSAGHPLRGLNSGAELADGCFGDPADAGGPVQLRVDLSVGAAGLADEQQHQFGVAFAQAPLLLAPGATRVAAHADAVVVERPAVTDEGRRWSEVVEQAGVFF